MSGSTTVLPLAEALADGFMDEYSDVEFEISGGGSGVGMEECADGDVDIGMSSRELDSGDPDLVAHEIAKDGVAIVVNEENPVDELSMEEVRSIYSGEITNWEEVGGEDWTIVVVSREEGSGTRKFFEEKVMEGEDITDDALEFDSNEDARDKVIDEEGAIGYVSTGYVEDVKGIALDGVEPILENCQSGDYPLVRSLYFLHLPPEPSPNKLIEAFMEFCLDDGQEIVEDEGYIPIS
jgi:phosphate transport system substrate-binding protein